LHGLIKKTLQRWVESPQLLQGFDWTCHLISKIFFSPSKPLWVHLVEGLCSQEKDYWFNGFDGIIK